MEIADKASNRSWPLTVTNLLLAAGGVTSVLILSYVIYHYGWTAERQFASSAGMVLYVAAPAVLAVLFFSLLTLEPAHKTRVVVLCLALTAAVYGLEVFLYLNDPETLHQSAELDRLVTQAGLVPDTRDAVQVTDDLRKKGIDAVRGVITPIGPQPMPGDVRPASAGPVHGAGLMPLSGIAGKPTVVCRESDEWRIFDSDEHGFHNPPGVWQPGNVDIAALGNSWTQGWCVRSDRNFVALIRRRYDATVNLGMAGEGPLQLLAVTKEYLSFLRPRLVLWFYFEGNSLLELQDERQHRLLMRYLEDDFGQDLVRRQHDIDQRVGEHLDWQTALEGQRRAMSRANRAAYLPAVIGFGKLTALRQALGLVYGTDTRERGTLADLEGPTMELFSEIVALVKTYVGAWGGTVSFVYLPSRERYAHGDPGIAGQQRARILQLVDRLDIPIIDLVPVFSAHRDPLSLFPFRRYFHYNDEGHRVVADEVLKAIAAIPLKARKQ